MAAIVALEADSAVEIPKLSVQERDYQFLRTLAVIDYLIWLENWEFEVREWKEAKRAGGANEIDFKFDLETELVFSLAQGIKN